VNDPDAIWKPGYDGPPPIVGSIDEPAEEAAADVPVAARSRRRWFGVGVAIALVVVGAVVVLDPLGIGDDSNDDPNDDSSVDEVPPGVIERPDPTVFGGAAARRLPDDAAVLWSLDVAHDGDHWVEVIRRDLVVAAVVAGVVGPSGAPGDTEVPASPPPPPTTTIVALDAPTGEQRWRLEFAGSPREMTVVGAVDDVLVFERPGVVGPAVTGVDVVTGETRWSIDAALNDGHVGLIGTPFIARLPASPDRPVALIDARSGRTAGAIASDPLAAGRPAGWSTDGQGTWYVNDDGVVVEYDLRDALGEATAVARVDDGSTPALVVDGRLAVIDDSGAVAFESIDAGSAVTVSSEVPTPALALSPVSDSAFVVAAPRTISGVAVEGDAANVTWLRRDGVVVTDHPVVGSSLIQVTTRGGAANQLVDGLTGETVEHFTMMPGALQALVVAGDGVVVLRASDVGGRLTGIDLDGTERWTIPGSVPVLVGDRIVVRATSNDTIAESSSSLQLRITAYGDVE